MKILSTIVTVIGVIALLLAVLGMLLKTPFFNVTSGGYIRGATALYLLSLVLMCHDRLYCKRKDL